VENSEKGKQKVRKSKIKLSESDAQEILQSLAKGVRASFLAKKYNVSPNNISNIKHKKTYVSWNNLPPSQIDPATSSED